MDDSSGASDARSVLKVLFLGLAAFVVWVGVSMYTGDEVDASRGALMLAVFVAISAASHWYSQRR